MKTFSIGAILSVTTGILLAEFSEVHQLIEHMAGEPVWTHQIPRVAREAEQTLLDQFPQFDGIVVPEMTTREQVTAWLAPLVSAHGERHEVTPLPRGEHIRMDPMAELDLMKAFGAANPDMRVHVVEVQR